MPIVTFREWVDVVIFVDEWVCVGRRGRKVAYYKHKGDECIDLRYDPWARKKELWYLDGLVIDFGTGSVYELYNPFDFSDLECQNISGKAYKVVCRGNESSFTEIVGCTPRAPGNPCYPFIVWVKQARKLPEAKWAHRDHYSSTERL